MEKSRSQAGGGGGPERRKEAPPGSNPSSDADQLGDLPQIPHLVQASVSSSAEIGKGSTGRLQGGPRKFFLNELTAPAIA